MESLDCAQFCCRACRKQLEHRRSLGRNSRLSQVFLPASWVALHRNCNLTSLISHLYINAYPSHILSTIQKREGWYCQDNLKFEINFLIIFNIFLLEIYLPVNQIEYKKLMCFLPWYWSRKSFFLVLPWKWENEKFLSASSLRNALLRYTTTEPQRLYSELGHY